MTDRNEALEKTVHELAREGFDHEFGKPRRSPAGDPVWKKMTEAGSTLWLDTGDLEEAARHFTAEFEALTTNNTLLNKEIQKGLYDKLVGKAAARIREVAPDISDQELLLEIGFYLNAYHGLRLVEEFDCKVSVELHTDLAHDAERSHAYGLRYYAICPERFIVKVPFTAAGLIAARKLVIDKVPINFTLGFSARQNHVIARFTNPDYVNVFMGRLNSFVADHQLGKGENVGEKATLATQRELIRLRKDGQSQSKLIGASLRSGQQVLDLAGIDVYTMPPAAAAAFREIENPDIRSRIDENPDVPLAEGVRLEDFNGQNLWEISSDFRSCVDGLLALDLDNITDEDIQTHFKNGGFGDFLPEWTAEDIETIRKDGKIPAYETWKEELQRGGVGLDALMNLSALYAFATDQAAMDQRVRGLL